MGLLYTKTKIFHFKEKMDSLPKAIDSIEPPLHIRINQQMFVLTTAGIVLIGLTTYS